MLGVEPLKKKITANTCVPGYPNYAVLNGGEYDEEELVEVYDINDNSVKVAFQAHYIACGRVIAEDV